MRLAMQRAGRHMMRRIDRAAVLADYCDEIYAFAAGLEEKLAPEKKKTAVGVRGMKLSGTDTIESAHLMTEVAPFMVEADGKKKDLSKLKITNRDGKGSKLK